MWRDENKGIDAVASEYRWNGRRWLRPLLADEMPPTPLMTWWALLYGLSMLARYHPARWVLALDPDASSEAVMFERVLGAAISAIPHLVLEALLGEPVLMNPERANID